MRESRNMDLFGKGTTVIGMPWLRGGSVGGDRRTVGAHAPLGFGAGGILAEHDFTARQRTGPLWPRSTDTPPTRRCSGRCVSGSWRQPLQSGCGGAVRDARDGQRRLKLTARLMNQATIGVSERVQRGATTRRTTATAAFQVALKSPE
jgi:hypothetical protein